MQTVDIIIPVYKTETFLPECMDSVLQQDYPALHVVLVDDGSPDGAGALCDQYEKQYPFVTSVHQKNQGLGIARNTGMENSSGAYILFLDSDDRLDGKSAVSSLVAAAEAADADITVGAFRRFNEHGISGVNDHHLTGLLQDAPVFRFRGFYQYGHLSYSWGKLYRRAFLERYDLKQKPYPFTQDKAHNFACYARGARYALIPDSVALYRVNTDSVTFRYKENLIPVWVSIAEDFAAYLEEEDIPGDYNDLISLHLFFGSFFLAKQELSAHHGIRGAARMLKAYRGYPIVEDMMRRLAYGKIVNGLDVFSWRIAIRFASFLFCLHFDHLLAFGIYLLRRAGMDQRITDSRYQNKKEPSA